MLGGVSGLVGFGVSGDLFRRSRRFWDIVEDGLNRLFEEIPVGSNRLCRDVLGVYTFIPLTSVKGQDRVEKVNFRRSTFREGVLRSFQRD